MTGKKKEETVRKPPYSVEAEKSIFGCIFLNGENALDAVGLLYEADFFVESHRIIYSAICEIMKSNRAVDMVTVGEFLSRKGNLVRVGGIEYLADLSMTVPSAAAFRDYVEIVRRMSIIRQLIASCNDITKLAYNAGDTVELLAAAEKKIFDIGKAGSLGGLEQIIDTLGAVYNELNELNKNPDGFAGVKTGFWKLDSMTSGFQPGQLIIIAARPAVGKSSFALNIIEHAIKNDKCCALFSLEMPKDQIAKRLICSFTGTSMANMMPQGIKDLDWAKTYDAVRVLSRLKFFIDDSAAVTPPDILSRCRRLKSKFGLDMVVVDYLQLMSGGGRMDNMGGENGMKTVPSNRQQEVSDISRSLKVIAKELGVPVVALSQLSRQIENRPNSDPQLSDLRDSGAIEQDADIVAFLHYDKSQGETDMSKLIIAKHRNGATGEIPLRWLGESVRFESYTFTETQRIEQAQRLQARLAQEAKKLKDGKKLAKPDVEAYMQGQAVGEYRDKPDGNAFTGTEEEAKDRFDAARRDTHIDEAQKSYVNKTKSLISATATEESAQNEPPFDVDRYNTDEDDINREIERARFLDDGNE